ncbi:MAG: hypothetical protein KKE62_04290 [Proteobacteria bacterium]|nr:hypothetical protein [Pseudomonadota bacterium]MBU1387980.1 hypothetical protein [Pseudomonadota bacterium]MBU1542043.1 hypothetical protein [Pseudomonadota bacterium]
MNLILPKGFALAAAIIIVVTSPASGEEKRSPFDEPPRPVSAYNYEAARDHCVITGLIITRTESKVILKTRDQETGSVYSVKDRIRILHNSVSHEFILERIKPKSIVLRGKNAEAYEVEAR